MGLSPELSSFIAACRNLRTGLREALQAKQSQRGSGVGLLFSRGFSELVHSA